MSAGSESHGAADHRKPCISHGAGHRAGIATTGKTDVERPNGVYITVCAYGEGVVAAGSNVHVAEANKGRPPNTHCAYTGIGRLERIRDGVINCGTTAIFRGVSLRLDPDRRGERRRGGCACLGCGGSACMGGCGGCPCMGGCGGRRRCRANLDPVEVDIPVPSALFAGRNTELHYVGPGSERHCTADPGSPCV